jgi:putative membrane protein insertion efficiency factor
MSAAAPLFRRTARAGARLPATALLALIRLYQRTLSPALPVITLGRCGCRFHPTCSHYAAGAIQAHGVLAGLTLAARRLAKCTPLHPGGFDPVPARKGPSDQKTKGPKDCPELVLS